MRIVGSKQFDMSINFYLPLLFPPLKHCQCVALFFTNCSICIQYTSNLIRFHLILSAALNSLIESPFFFCGCWKKYQITIRWSNSICLFFFRILKAGIPFNRTSLFPLDVTFARQNTTEIAFNVNSTEKRASRASALRSDGVPVRVDF